MGERKPTGSGGKPTIIPSLPHHWVIPRESLATTCVIGIQTSHEMSTIYIQYISDWLTSKHYMLFPPKNMQFVVSRCSPEQHSLVWGRIPIRDYIQNCLLLLATQDELFMRQSNKQVLDLMHCSQIPNLSCLWQFLQMRLLKSMSWFQLNQVTWLSLPGLFLPPCLYGYPSLNHSSLCSISWHQKSLEGGQVSENTNIILFYSLKRVLGLYTRRSNTPTTTGIMPDKAGLLKGDWFHYISSFHPVSETQNWLSC